MKKALWLLIFVCLLGGGGFAYYKYTAKPVEPTIQTGTISRGSIVDSVGSTGALSAVSQVVVGAQVGGIILELGADFNSIVKKGQVLAKLDPQTVETQILSAKANLVRSQTDVDRAKVTLADAQRKFDRSKELLAKKLVPQSDYDAAELTLRSAESSLKSSEAALQQSDASLKQNEVNLEHTIILSPIDGLVISRAVDVGQTVNASMSAPPIFTIAADLTKMKVIAGVDETDVGRIRPQQNVTFRVDAYPNETFRGTVEQVRLEPKMQQNVVTYQTVISVPNPDLKLKPGMTANLTVEIGRIDDALRIPNAALRFRPTGDMYTALGLQPPADSGRGGRGGGRGGPGGPAAPGGTGQQTASAAGPGEGGPATATTQTGQPAAGRSAEAAAAPGAGRPANGGRSGGRNGGPGASADELSARMQNMTPEERDRMMAGRGGRGGGNRNGSQGFNNGGGQNGVNGGRGGNRGPGGQGNRGQGGQGRGGGRGNGNRNANGNGNGNGQGRGGNNGDTPTAVELSAARGATTIDSLFPALVRPDTRGRAYTWNKEKKELTMHNLRLGITDGQTTQVIDAGDLAEGAEVLTNIITASVRPGPNQNQQGNPFFPGGGGRGPGGPGGGGNRGGGGGRGGF